MEHFLISILPWNALEPSVLSIINKDQYDGQIINNSVFTTSYKVKNLVNLSSYGLIVTELLCASSMLALSIQR